MWKALFHLSVTVANSYVLWYDQKYLDIPFPVKIMEAELPFRARSTFLTMWCLVLQTVYHFIAFTCDILGESSSKERRALHRVRDGTFSVAFPLALYVTGAFWSIYFIDRDLIFPEHLDKIFPPMFNHVMHTTVAIFMFIELFITYREYPRRGVGLSAITIVVMSYTVWFLYIYAKYNTWVYPVFDRLCWLLRIVFIATSVATAGLLYIAGEKVNDLVCPQHNKKLKTVTNGKSKNS